MRLSPTRSAASLPRGILLPRFPTLLALLALSVAAMGVALGFALARAGGDGTATAGVALGLSVPRLTNDGAATAGAPELPRTGGPLIVYSEFGETHDTIWAAAPDEPQQRAQLASVEHAPGYGIYPSLSPDGRYVAYTVSRRAGRGDTGELRALEIATGETSILADNIDLRIAPVWSAGADAVAVRRSAWQDTSGSFQLLRVDLAGGETLLVDADAGLFPIGFSPDGVWLYFAALSPAGTDLTRVPASGGTGDPRALLSDGGAGEPLAHLSDGVARDWHLSPDGARLAYLAQPATDAGSAFVARVLDLATGGVTAAGAGAGVAQFNPVWETSGALTVGTLTSGEGGVALRLGIGGAASSLRALAAPAGGFDVPLAWSPDSAHLAVRSFASSSLADPGPSRIVVVDPDGTRHELAASSDIAIAGWLQPE